MALSSVLLALTAGCDTSSSAGAWQLSRAEMMAIAQDNSARIQHALAAHDVGVYMANKARCLTLFVPLRGERSYAEDYGGMCELLSPLLDGSIARLQEWPYRIYIGNNTATYLLTSMCARRARPRAALPPMFWHPRARPRAPAPQVRVRKRDHERQRADHQPARPALRPQDHRDVGAAPPPRLPPRSRRQARSPLCPVA